MAIYNKNLKKTPKILSKKENSIYLLILSSDLALSDYQLFWSLQNKPGLILKTHKEVKTTLSKLFKNMDKYKRLFIKTVL